MIRYLEHLTDKEQVGVLALIAAAADHDGIPPIAEHIVLHLRHGGDKDDRHFVLTEDDAPETIVGYAHIDLTDPVAGSSAELVVHPGYRGRGHGRALLDEITRLTSPRLWSHGDLASARSLASDKGFSRVRSVIQMRRSLEIPLPSVNADVEIRSFLPGLDDEAWLQLNNTIFISHPEQGNWTIEDLHNRMKESWFDPSGFLLATRDSRILAFCWTKVHGAHTHSHASDSTEAESEHGHDPIGEIYAMGVDSAESGKGVGRAITVAGLSFLRFQGLNSAMLYVDAENTAAINLYKGLGFSEWGRDVMYKKLAD